MKIIVGLGNPGDKYRNTRHNIGFEIIDQFVKKNNLGSFETSSKLKSELLKANYKGNEIIIIKPNTFMNNSGNAASLVLGYYKLKPDDLIVINDDLDIELGKIKIATSGSSVGHRGIQSIIDRIGADDFVRVRVGISHPRNNNSNIPVEDYVLMRFDEGESNLVNESINASIYAIDQILENGANSSMNNLN